jgi:CRP-like cAMP-binding protein
VAHLPCALSYTREPGDLHVCRNAFNLARTPQGVRQVADPIIDFIGRPLTERASVAVFYEPQNGSPMKASPIAHRSKNQFLENMPANGEYALRPLLKRTQLKHGELVYEAGGRMTNVFFPMSSLLSVVLDMSDGETAEVGIIGCEGMTGLSIALGQSSSNQRTVVQIPDSAEYMPAEEFRRVLEDQPELRAFSLRYAQATLMASSQLSACNNLHPTDERCARWLLSAHDRVEDDLLLLTQEFLSQMLGVRRGGVTIAASALQEAGFISYTRGHITVRNRSGLESAACECYETVQRNWQEVMGYHIGHKYANGSYARVEGTRGAAKVRGDGQPQ